MLKPSEHAPATACAFVAACYDAGVPDGLIQLVHGYAEPGAAIAVHPGVGAVSFTGSVPTGRKVAAAAMETGPRVVSLELGGKNAMVVRPDADLDLVVDGAIFGAFGTSGQRCTSTSRLIVHPDVAGELVERIAKRAAELRLGDPTDPSTDVGPVINRAAADRIAGMVADAIAEGATLSCGGRARHDVFGCDGGAFFEPTVRSSSLVRRRALLMHRGCPPSRVRGRVQWRGRYGAIRGTASRTWKGLARGTGFTLSRVT